jgi:hypothetical protein
MIQYDKDGVTVFYVAGDGTKVSASPIEGARYSDLLTIMDAQLAAVRENNAAKEAYVQAVANAQISVSAGRPASALPVKPREKFVSDTGVVTDAAFATGVLPELTYPQTTPSAGGIVAPGSKPVTAAADMAEQDHAMITAMYRKMFPPVV